MLGGRRRRIGFGWGSCGRRCRRRRADGGEVFGSGRSGRLSSCRFGLLGGAGRSLRGVVGGWAGPGLNVGVDSSSCAEPVPEEGVDDVADSARNVGVDNPAGHAQNVVVDDDAGPAREVGVGDYVGRVPEVVVDDLAGPERGLGGQIQAVEDPGDLGP